MQIHSQTLELISSIHVQTSVFYTPVTTDCKACQHYSVHKLLCKRNQFTIWAAKEGKMELVVDGVQEQNRHQLLQ